LNPRKRRQKQRHTVECDCNDERVNERKGENGKEIVGRGGERKK
jgi:hypothetical protein